MLNENTPTEPDGPPPRPDAAEPTSPYAVLERMGDAFVALDTDDRWLYVNAEAERVLGRSRKELVGRVVWDVYPEARGTAFGDGLRRARATGAQVSVADYIPSSGRWVENRIHPLRGGVTYVHFTDATERHRAQERAEHLASLACALSEALTAKEVAGAILRAALPPLGATVGVVCLLSEDGATVETLAAVGLPAAGLEPWRTFPADADLPISNAIRTQQLVVLPSPEAHDAAYPKLAALRAASASPDSGVPVAVPLLVGGRAVGGIGLICPTERVSGEEGRAFLWTVAGQCALALERARLFDAEREARRRAEREARARGQAQELAHRLIESSPDCIKTLDLNGVILSMSEGGRRLLEMEDAETLCGTDWRTLWPDEETRSAYRSALEEAAAGGVGRFQGFCPTQKGAPRWWDVVIVPLLDADGRPEKLLSATRDITDRRQAEQREKAFLASVFQQAPAFMCALRGPRHTYELANLPYYRLIGKQADFATQAILGKTVAEVIPEMVEQGFIALLDHVYTTGEAHVGTDTRVAFQVKPDGPREEHFVDFTFQPLVEADGTVSGILVHGVDLTERKRLEQEREAAMAAQRESQERLELAFEAVHLGMWELDLRTGEQVWSGEQERLFGLERGGFGGSVGSFLDRVHPEDRERVAEHARRSFADPDTSEYEDEFRVVRSATGEVCWLYGRARIERAAETGEALRVTGVNLDITERKRAEETLRRAAERGAVLNRINTALRSSLDPDEIEDAAVTILGEALGADRCYMVTYHVAENYSTIACEYRSRADALPPMAGRYTLSDYDAVMRSFRVSPEAQVVRDVRLEAGLDADAIVKMEGFRMRAYVRVPLYESGKLVGSMAVAMAHEPRAWTPQEVDLVLTVAAQVRAVLEAARAHKELEEAEAKQRRIADTLQESLLLSPLAIDAFPGLEVDTHYEAAWDEAQIGGDYGDAFRVDERRVAVLVGDGTGKGLAAARFVAECEFLCRAFLRENPDDPADALLRLNRMLLKGQQFDARPEGALTTLAVAVIDTRTGEAVLAAGGAEPPLVMRADTGEAEEVEVRGALLGADPAARYEAVRVPLSPGDVVFLTTDGTTEARNRKTRQFFGYDGVTEAVRQVALRNAGVGGAAREIVARARAFAGGVLTDDACVLVARYTGDGGPSQC